jgi:hypothetical protein
MHYVFARARIRVRDSSEKPAMSVANEDLQRIARPRSAAQGTRPRKKSSEKLQNNFFELY